MNNDEVMTTGQWILTTLIMAIPLVGIVMTFVWAFGNGNNNRKNYCRAALIWTLIGIVLCSILAASGISILSSLGSGYY